MFEMMSNKIKSVFELSQNWEEFKNRVDTLTSKEKGHCFEQLNKFYLLINPKYRTLLKKVWLLEDVPIDVRNHLRLPNQDEGIDLILETKEGNFWAVQSKYRGSENHSLNRKELSTFTDLAFNVCKNISHALICTNSIKLSPKFSLYQGNVSFCASDIWCNLDLEFFNDVRKLLKGKEPEPRKLQPRKHQQIAINNAQEHFKNNSRGRLIHPCSAGKTLTAYWIAKSLNAKAILVTVPSLSLINQTLEEWANRFIADNLNASWICVCSDETVKNVTLDSNEIDVRDLGIEVFTDPEIISQWLKRETADIKVVFSTYQSGAALAEATKTSSFIFDLAVMDEAHKTVGQKGSLFTHLLDDKNILISKRLFMTATERHFKGTSEEVLSMDDEEIYGQTIHLYTFKDAITDKILSDYKIVTMTVTEEEIKNLIENNFYIKPTGKHWRKEVESQMLAAVIALRKAYSKFEFSHALSYHSSLSRAKAFNDAQVQYGRTFLENDQLQTFHVQGDTPAGLRSQIFKNFINADKGLITNVRCLTEGVNIPKIDSILFADPKKSKVDIVQAVGRALRPHKDKKMSYIIVPVLIDEVVDDLEAIKNKTFEAILQIIKALATHDERIIEYFQAISSTPKRGANRDYYPFEIDIPLHQEIDSHFFHNGIDLLLWDKLAKLSWKSFDEAKLFVHSLNLKNHDEWKKYCNSTYPDLPEKPYDIPRTPWIVYQHTGWTSMGDWLGTDFIATSKREYKSFIEARNFVHKLKLKSQSQWVKYCRNELLEKGLKPLDIPYDPATVYKDEGWVSVGDWLGTNVIATRSLKFRPFNEALSFVHTLGLKTQGEWKEYCQGKLPEKGFKPDDIPANPNITYKKNGWENYGHWLGTGYISPRYRQYKTYEEARDFARPLGLENYKDWRTYCEGKILDKPSKPDDIPAKPDGTYKNEGWISWSDFLGTDNVSHGKKRFLPYEEAKIFVMQLKFRNQSEWKAYCKGTHPLFGKKPDNLPKAPDHFYEDWETWGEWLGSGYVACSRRKYRSFEEAREFVRALGLTGQKQWRQYTKGLIKELPPLPKDIPANPNQTYKDNGWNGFGDWFGTGIIAPRLRKYLPFQNARSFIRELNLKNQKEWGLYCQGKLAGLNPKPTNIPSNPYSIYKNEGWIGLGDWLGTNVIAYSKKTYLSFEEARAFVHKLHLLNSTEWSNYCKGEVANKPLKPTTISNRPEITYKNKGWEGWEDWLGNSYIPTRRKYCTFKEAKKFVQSLKIETQAQWRLYCQGQLKDKVKIPKDIPHKPERSYINDGWNGYPDWLGNQKRASPKFIGYLSFEEAKIFVHKLSLKNCKEWTAFCKGKYPNLGQKPQNIPTHPERFYVKLGWKGYGDWLGTNTPSPLSRIFLPYEEAKSFVLQLKLTNRTEWNQYCSGKILGKPPLPNNIPKDPVTVYRNKGWIGVGDWLGTNRKATHLREYLPFNIAREFVRKLNLNGRDGWKAYCAGKLKLVPLPDNIPKAPWIVYKDSGWKSLSDWLSQ